MGFFDKFKKKNETIILNEPQRDEPFEFEIDGITFIWDEKPKDNYVNTAKNYAEAYKTHLPQIIDFMLPDLQEIYGTIDFDEVKTKLGKPIINYMNGTVTYCEQLFDDIHIFLLNFLMTTLKIYNILLLTVKLFYNI